MRSVTFEIPADRLDALCDGVLAELPHGLRSTPLTGDRARITAVGLAGDLPDRTAFEAAAGSPLQGYDEQDTPADAAARRAASRGGLLIGDRLVIRSPEDPEPGAGDSLDVVIERSAGGFGTGTHPTTRMCLELLLDLPAGGGFADLGCGLGVLAIVAARLGYSPVTALDRSASALEVARANARRNGVEIEFTEADLTAATVPPAATLALNAPPALHAVVAEGLPAVTRVLIASGLPLTELDTVLERYRAAGLDVIERRVDHVWGAAVLARARTGDG